MEPSKDLRVKRTYKLLSESLLELMKKMPFEKITITDICNNAMVHRTTFYTHFTDKYDLLKYSLSELERPFDTGAVKEESFEGYKEFYMDAAQKTLCYIDSHIEIFKVFLKKNQEDSLVTMIQNALTEKLTQKLLKCQETGIKLPVPVPVLANIYAGGCLNVLIWWIEQDRPCSLDQLLEYLDILIQPLSIPDSPRQHSPAVSS